MLSELAVVPSAVSGLPSSNAWPARPRRASTRHILGPTSLRAFRGVLSSDGVRADLTGHGMPLSGGAAFLLETGSNQ